MKPVSLYIHLPFCARKCAYCDFASWPGREADQPAYVLEVEREMAQAAQRYGRLRIGTVFIGGGTPSLLSSDAVMHLTAVARARFDIDPDAEITLEANPGTLTPQKLRDYRASGVNRLSLGVQAAQSELLRTLGRIHDFDQAAQSMEWARAAGFQNINLDLMYALPGQSMAQWIETLQAALKLAPEHLSLYALIVEPGTPLARDIEAGVLHRPDDETDLAMQHAAERILSRRGYARYEISNYALAGRECRHNMVYWTRGDYLGVGCAAHSLMRGERVANTADLDVYLAGGREAERSVLTAEDVREEAIMLGTRTARGVDCALIDPGKAERMVKMGLARREGNRLCMTQRGWDLHNAVVAELI